MTVPIINVSATNIEQSAERQILIRQKLAPLARFVPSEREVNVEVDIKNVRDRFGEVSFLVSLNLHTSRGEYMAMARGMYLTRALSEAREKLRQSLCRGDSVLEHSLVA